MSTLPVDLVMKYSDRLKFLFRKRGTLVLLSLVVLLLCRNFISKEILSLGMILISICMFVVGLIGSYFYYHSVRLKELTTAEIIGFLIQCFIYLAASLVYSYLILFGSQGYLRTFM